MNHFVGPLGVYSHSKPGPDPEYPNTGGGAQIADGMM